MAPFFITGATGNQGGATGRALLSSGHQVHALVRDPSSAAAKALETAGVTLFRGTFSDVLALKQAATGCIGVFLNATPNFTSVHGELDDAKNIIDASLAAGVKHIVYTSVLGLKDDQNKTKHDLYLDSPIMISKKAIEDAVRDAKFETWTILRPGYFMTNFSGARGSLLFPELGVGVFKSAFKPTTKLPLIDPRDIGTASAKVLQDPGRWNGRIIDIALEPLAVEAVVRIMGETSGKELKVEQVENADDLGGSRGMIYQGQMMLNVLDEEGILEPDLSALKELGVTLRGLGQFLLV